MFTFAEFFAGIGLMRMGLERHGWTVAFANDISPQKVDAFDNTPKPLALRTKHGTYTSL